MGGQKSLSDDEETLRVNAEDLLDHEKAALRGLAGARAPVDDPSVDVHQRRTDVDSLPLPLEYWVEVGAALAAATAGGHDARKTLARFGLSMAQWLEANQWWRDRVEAGLVDASELSSMRETYRAKYR